ncbi:MAG: AIPR family protein [Corallococcus sp.]|nr:AIPR family protein [Corallococcus sp.]MCM1359049.1 AIPR family protein [Corallococcus sp.]MCM1395038.1 AIPR family protein [Corallococcus sp.]
MPKVSFNVKSFRKIPNPYIKSECGDPIPEMYIMLCDVKDLPDNIPMDTNPREQRLTTGVAKKIKESLLDTTINSFYLLNRGLLLSADTVFFDNYLNEVTVDFSDTDYHGNVDGGHTYKIILENRDKLEFGKQYVKVEIITGVDGIFQTLAAARNTSVQVKDESIAELEHKFQIIKDALDKLPFSSKINYKENDDGDIEIVEILAILNMFNITRYPALDSFPIPSYSSRKKCLDYYLEEYRLYGDSNKNSYIKMKNIIPDIFHLYEHLEQHMQFYYRQRYSGGKYGAVKGVFMSNEKKQFKSKFFFKSLDYFSPNGFIYPILGALRALIKEENDQFLWKKDPYEVLDKLGPALVETTIERSRSLGNNPQSVGKDSGNWKTLYMTVAFDLLET